MQLGVLLPQKTLPSEHSTKTYFLFNFPPAKLYSAILRPVLELKHGKKARMTANEEKIFSKRASEKRMEQTQKRAENDVATFWNGSTVFPRVATLK